jgi:hypothetical protein
MPNTMRSSSSFAVSAPQALCLRGGSNTKTLKSPHCTWHAALSLPLAFNVVPLCCSCGALELAVVLRTTTVLYTVKCILCTVFVNCVLPNARCILCTSRRGCLEENDFDRSSLLDYPRDIHLTRLNYLYKVYCQRFVQGTSHVVSHD